MKQVKRVLASVAFGLMPVASLWMFGNPVFERGDYGGLAFVSFLGCFFWMYTAYNVFWGEKS